jgi:hypothetical protein
MRVDSEERSKHEEGKGRKRRTIMGWEVKIKDYNKSGNE